uniref:Zgc:195212 n=1 Tax=Cyprinus carpio TaxID=7962 RepID=A0A8C1LIC9_CYPCA
MDHSITMEISPFSSRCLPSFPQMHPVLGDTLSCVLPTDTIEAGLCGEMNMVTMATLAPCMDQYSNWPTRLSCIRISFVIACGMPLMQQTQMSFLQSLATSTSWDLCVLNVECVEFSLETDYSQESRCSCTVQQNIEKRLRLSSFFAQYSDSFRSQISDFISSEEVFERHLDAVLWYNGDQVRVTLQSTMKNTLKEFQQRHGVKSTSELCVSLRQSLQNIVDGCFAPMSVCSNVKVFHFCLLNHPFLEFKNTPELSSKRIHCDLQCSSFIPKKRQSSEMFSENSDTFMNSVFEAANIQRNPLSPKQLPQTLSLAKLKNEQVEKQWLQELENFSEWD